MLIQVVGFIISLVIIVAIIVRRANYGLALLIGTVTLGVFSQISPREFLDVFIMALTDMDTFDLALIVSLISMLAYCMKEAGMVNNLIMNIKRVLSGRAVLMVLPALMGALPMPGGALLSAPLINEEAERLKLTGEERSFINVWFRHWNFLVYPLSSPLILLESLTGVSIYTLVLIQVLPALLYLFLGYFVSIRKIRGDEIGNEPRRDAKTFLSIFLNTSPILLTLLLNLLGVHMAIALTAGIVFTLLVSKVKIRKAAVLLRKGFDWKLPFAIIGVMCFRQMIDYSGSVSAILPYIKAANLPPTVILLIIAWTIGLVTAMPTAGIAMIVPIAAIIVGNFTPILTSLLYLTTIFSYLISPMHLCLILTIEYYKAHLHIVYRKLIPAAMTIYIAFLTAVLIIQNLQNVFLRLK